MQDNQERLTASPRTLFGKKSRFLRREGWSPANIFGRGVKSVAIQLRTKEIDHLLGQAHRSPLISLTVDSGAPATVLVKAIQRKPTTGELYHVDFYRVSMTRTLRSVVSLEFVGEAPAVRVHEATILRSIDSLEVECLPGDLPSTIVVDLERLVELDDAIHVRDLDLPSGVQAVRDPDEIVVKAMRPTVEVEEEPVEEAAQAAPAAEAAPSESAEASSSDDEADSKR